MKRNQSVINTLEQLELLEIFNRITEEGYEHLQAIIQAGKDFEDKRFKLLKIKEKREPNSDENYEYGALPEIMLGSSIWDCSDQNALTFYKCLISRNSIEKLIQTFDDDLEEIKSLQALGKINEVRRSIIDGHLRPNP